MSSHIKSLTIKVAATEAQATRAVKAEAHLESAQKLLETIQGQADALKTERDQLREEVQRLKDLSVKRTRQAMAGRRALKKQKKLLEQSEERFFLSTHDLLVRRAAEAGLDYKAVMLEGMDDPVGRDDGPDQGLVVSSASEAELSD